MNGERAIDLPRQDSEAQVLLPSSGYTVTSRVESVEGDVLVLLPVLGESAGRSVVTSGGLVEVQWQRPEDQRAAPAEVVSVEDAGEPRWRLRITGPARVVQRREAVRGRVVLPVELRVEDTAVKGETADLSETGARISVRELGRELEPGSGVQLSIALEDSALSTRAEVIRAHTQGKRSTLSLRFLDVEEKEQDRIRRRVFQALREERARSID
jgi:hypothetical protein